MSSAGSEPHHPCTQGTEVQREAELAQCHTAGLWPCGQGKQEVCLMLLRTPGGGHTLSFNTSLIYISEELF